jgi:hypothetical protein
MVNRGEISGMRDNLSDGLAGKIDSPLLPQVRIRAEQSGDGIGETTGKTDGQSHAGRHGRKLK